MTHLKRQNYFVKIEISQTRPYNMQRLTFLHRTHYVRSYLCFFYLNKVLFVVFAVLDVSSIPLQKGETYVEVFFTLIVK